MAGAGKFVWYELMTNNLDAAEKFYADVVGWKMKDAGMPGMRYTLAHAGESRAAGLMAIPPDAAAAGARPGWIGYVGVDDVDAYAKRVKDKGGAVHREPADIPTVGRFAIVGDPQGVMFALFKGEGTPPPPATPGTPGHAGWHELHAIDGVKAFDFYSGMFGWTKGTTMPMGDLGVYQLFAINGVEIGGMMTKMPQSPVPFWVYYFNVPEIKAAEARVKAGGGQIINGPMEVPGGSWILQAIDPQGAMFALVAPPAS
ncbi:MAG: VOC family protein [Methylobacteriaceae bacterium]|nr:VOC family protein [Methylobacteriaceae bacterium]